MKPGRLPVLLPVLLLLCGCTAPSPPEAPRSAVFFAMDTVMELSVYGGGEEALEEASALVERLEGLFSATDAASEVYAANHSGGAPVPVSDDTARLVEQALALCGDTDGALDISIYPAVGAWGFPTGAYQVPEADVLAALLERVDYRRISLEDGLLTVPAGMEIDLGAVAKGYAGDRIQEQLRQAGVSSALLNLGGNLYALGTKPDGSPWRLAVRDPEGGGYAGIIEAADKAVVTSGGYERYFEEEGVRYWHILDPADGLPARSGLASATVVSGSGVQGDALSTALFVMGREKAVAYWRERRDFDFVLIGEDGAVTVSEGLADCFSLYGAWASHPLEVARG